ncbi:MAG: hypothetical protein GY820_37190, partial [Gammaproteobacteria bacterium]|nr:hypothetical protein [Gammaproteobacteria bacterium]
MSNPGIGRAPVPGSRSIPDISNLLQPLEDAIRNKLLPALLGKHVSDSERNIIALPAKLGGLGIYDPTKTADREYRCSRLITKQLVDLITSQKFSLDDIVQNDILKTKNNLKVENNKLPKETVENMGGG